MNLDFLKRPPRYPGKVYLFLTVSNYTTGSDQRLLLERERYKVVGYAIMNKRFLRVAQTLILAFMVTGFQVWAVAPDASIDVASLGPQVGELVPDFRLSDQNDRFHTRDSILGSKGAILLFYRSADW